MRVAPLFLVSLAPYAALSCAAAAVEETAAGGVGVAPGTWIEASGPKVAPPNGLVLAGGFAEERADLALEVVVDGTSRPVLGTALQTGSTLRFEPRFPFEPGTPYRLRVRNGDEVITDVEWELTRPDLTPTTRVLSVSPAHPVLPSNLLKLYVTFSAPMRRGQAYRHLRLERGDGSPADGVFLQLDPELWDPESRRLTLLLDPGRIKRGLALRDELGPTLVTGEDYVFRIDAGWRDARGVQLAEAYALRFRAGPPDREAPRPQDWLLKVPAAGTLDPLILTLDEPLDRALLERVVFVQDAVTRLAWPGEVSVAPGETEWRFTPDKPWRAGSHDLVADGVLEDRSGNTPGRAFETEVGAAEASGEVLPTVLRFEVR